MINKKNTPSAALKETRFRAAENVELMTFLLSKMGGMSRNSIKSLLAHRQVMVNDKITTQFNKALRPADLVVVSSMRGNMQLSHPKIKIIFEDQYLIVVEKKEGLLTVSTGKSDETTAFSILKNYVIKSSKQNRIFVVHRLDRETSGIILFAKTREIQLAMQEHWHEVVTRRVYVALVEGKVEKEKDTIITWLTENEKSLKIHSSNVDNGGQQAITHYRVVKSNDKFSLLEIELETGRKNQIRVHLQGIGHPIVGDKKYGSTFSPITRLGLHARILA
ncbi:MAG: RluA family pseudouridine synthase, partial [Paludibacter sp.]|nr:RluA family pseudouridine synthase [Paludibacter sp.]